MLYEVKEFLPLYFKYVFTLCVWMHDVGGGEHATAHVWRPEGSLVELALSFHPYMGSEHPAQIARLI